MNSHPSVLPANPVLGRFTEIRDLWLGMATPKVVRKTTKRRQIGLKTRLKIISKALTKKTAKTTINLAIGLGLIVGVIWLGPKLVYSLFPYQEEQVQAEAVTGDFNLTIDEARLEARPKKPSQRNYQPVYNANLPEGDWLMIPRIGVRSTLQPTENYEDALDTGVWWVPNFGQPGDRDLPMIVAGHRYGFKWWWESDYWRYHSFYLLPDLEVGDTIEVISNQRKYVYEIYAGEEGNEITDYEADLIVYTCKYLDSPVRIFRYARLDLSQGDTPLGVL